MTTPTPHDQPEALLQRLVELESKLAETQDELRMLRRKPRLGLVWEDQSEGVEDQMTTELPVLERIPSRTVGESADPHLLIEGDNLHALACLQYTHAGRIDVLYLDPPYNTRSKEGDRFRYNDDYVDPEDEWRHSKWLSFMDRRIRLAKELLAPGGFLAISIDDNEMAHLRLLLDAHFGEANVKTIVVKMSETTGMKMASVKRLGTIPKLKEYLLIAKPDGVKGMEFEPIPKGAWDDEYRWVVKGLTRSQRERLGELSSKEGGVNDAEVVEADKLLASVRLLPIADVMKLDNVKKADEGRWKQTNAWRIVQVASSTSVLELAKPKRATVKQTFFAVRSKRDHILYVVKGDYPNTSSQPRLRLLFADDNLTKHPGDFWADITTTGIDAEGGVTFKNGKKPLALLRRVINAHPKKDAVVLDFFAGSGSTGHAVATLNAADGGKRQAILVTNDEGNICSEVTFPRMKGVLTGKLANGKSQDPLPGALRGYRCKFVKITRNRDAMLRRLSGSASDIIAIRENAYDVVEEERGRYVVLGNGDRRVVVWCDWADDGLTKLLATHSTAEERRLYMFGFGEAIDGDVVAKNPNWEVEALPEPLRAALERAHRRSAAQ